MGTRARKKSCKHGKLKRSIKTKSGRRRRCKKKPRSSKRSKRRSKRRSKKRSGKRRSKKRSGKRRSKKRSGKRRGSKRRRGKKRGSKKRSRKHKIDAIPSYDEIESSPPQYYAPELERVMSRNNMLEDLLERTQQSCTNQISQLKYDNEVLEQRLAWEQAQQDRQQEQGYAYVDEEDDERTSEQVDRRDAEPVRARLFDGFNDSSDEDNESEMSIDDLESRLNESVGITIRHNVGSPDDIDIYEIDSPNFQNFLNNVVGEYYKMKRRTLESIINYIGMNPSTSNVSRCVKLLMIYSLCVIHSFYTALYEDNRRNPNDLPYTNPDEYLYRNWLRTGDEPLSNMEELKQLCLDVVERIVNGLDDDLTVDVDVVVNRNGFMHNMNPNAIEADKAFIENLCSI